MRGWLAAKFHNAFCCRVIGQNGPWWGENVAFSICGMLMKWAYGNADEEEEDGD